jgi:hypothetical protein
VATALVMTAAAEAVAQKAATLAQVLLTLMTAVVVVVREAIQVPMERELTMAE